MSRTVHGFQGKGLLLCLKREHVLAVVLPMSRGLPQLAVVDVRCHHFLETPLSVLTLTKTEQSYYNLSFAKLPQAKKQLFLKLGTLHNCKQVIKPWDLLIKSASPVDNGLFSKASLDT